MFEWDIFLSYGWSENGASEGDRKWVSDLREQLRIALRTQLGRDPQIFLDMNASRAGALTDTLAKALDKSRLFLFVVSPGSCRSTWCHWEMTRFLDRAACIATPTEVLLPEDRIFGVLLQPVAKEEIPAPLRLLDVFRTFDLTRRVEGRDETRPVLWPELAEAPLAEFDQLVLDIKNRIIELESHELKKVSPKGVSVFVASAPSVTHEKEYLTPLRRDLFLRGYSVVRASSVLGEAEQEYRIRLSAVLGETQLFVQIIGQLSKPAGWEESPALSQLRRANEYSTLSLFTWADPDSRDDGSLPDGLIRKIDSHFDRRQPFNDLRSALLKRAAELAQKAQVNDATGSKKAVIAFCEDDRQHARDLMRHLKERHGFNVQLALPPTQSPGNRTRINKGLFEEVDYVLVYFSRHEEWMVLTCKTVRGVSKKKEKGPSGALVVHPPPPSKEDCDQLDFITLRRASHDDFSEIDRWATGSKGAGA